MVTVAILGTNSACKFPCQRGFVVLGEDARRMYRSMPARRMRIMTTRMLISVFVMSLFVGLSPVSRVQGDSLETTGMYAGAIAIARAQLSESSDPAVLANAAEILVNAMRWTSGYEAALGEAGSLREMIAQSRPGSTKELALLDDLVLRLKGFQSAYLNQSAQAKGIVSRSPGSEQAAKAELGIARLTDSYCGRAQTVGAFKHVATSYPNSVCGEKSVEWLRDYYAKTRAYDQGVEDLRQLSISHTTTLMGAAAALAIGGLFEAKGDMSAAITSYQESIRRSSDSECAADAVIAVGRAYLAINGNAEALTKLAEIGNRYPGTQSAAAALLEMGRLYEAQGKPEWAYDVYKKLLSDCRQIPAEAHERLSAASESWFKKGRLSGHDGRLGDAIGCFEKAQDLAVSEEVAVNAQYQKAICYHSLGQDQAAVAEFQKLIRDHTSSHLSMRAEEWVADIKNLR